MRIPIYRPEEEKFQLVELDTDPSTPSSSESEPDSRPATPEPSDSDPETHQSSPSTPRATPQPPPHPFPPLPTFTLVIGGLGYIGSHATLELLRSGHNVIIIDNLSNAYPSVLDNLLALLDLHHLYQSSPPTSTQKPLVHFHRLDCRSRALPLLLESYTDLVMTIDAAGTQRMASRSRITGVLHLARPPPASWRRGDDVGRLVRRLRRYGVEGTVVLGGCDGEAAGGEVAGVRPAGRVVVMRCGGAVVGCDGSGLLGGAARGAAGAVTAGGVGGKGDFLHVLDVARAFVAALDWGEERGEGVRVVELGFRGREASMGGGEAVAEKMVERASVYVAGGGPAGRPRKSVARRAVGLWKLVRRW
ncbi:hypothetical protein QBC39DRAFT_398973 [Podospora conica]|nr:hypothetical protein QBC39DRAFT_398973 [Schizothecium conicum]